MKNIEFQSIEYQHLAQRNRKENDRPATSEHAESRAHWTGSTHYPIDKTLLGTVIDRQPPIRTEMLEPEENIMPYVLLTALGLLLMTALGPINF